MVIKELTRLKEATNLLDEMMSSMILPAAVEDTTGGGVRAPLSVAELDRTIWELRSSSRGTQSCSMRVSRCSGLV